MDKWFEDKFERERLRKYTQNRLNKNKFIFLRKLSITNWIIIANSIAFILLLIFMQFFKTEKILELLALQSNGFFAGKYWTLLTSMFMHVEIWHFLANMFSLFFIGNFLEKLIGRKRVFWLYIISGIFAGFFYALMSYVFGNTIIGAKIFGSPEIFAIGASGAIFSLLGILAVLTPHNKVYLIAGPLIALIAQAIIESIFKDSSLLTLLNFLVYFYLLFALFVIFSFNSKLTKLAIPIKMPFWLLPFVAIAPLVIIGLILPLPIGNSAHFGGLLIGLIYGFYLKNKYKKKTAMISNIFRN
jgi:uncharacterized protein